MDRCYLMIRRHKGDGIAGYDPEDILMEASPMDGILISLKAKTTIKITQKYQITFLYILVRILKSVLQLRMNNYPESDIIQQY